MKAILTSSTAHIYMKDENLRYLTVNQPFIDSLNSDMKSVEGLLDEDIFSESIASLRKKVDMQVLSADLPIYNIEEEIKNPDGESVWLVTSKIPVHDKNGKVTGLIGTSLNITDLVRARQEILKRDKILSAVSSIAYFLVRSDGWESLIWDCITLLGEATEKDVIFFARIHQSSDTSTCSITHFWWKNEPGDLNRDLFHIESEKIVLDAVPELIQHPSVHVRCEKNITSHYLLIAIYTSELLWGVIGYVDLISDKIISSSEVDSLITASGIIGSVIQRHQAEELFHQPVERSLVGIYLMQDDRFVYVNPRMSDILGYTREELIALSFPLIFHPDDAALAGENHSRVLLKSEATDDYEIRAITADSRTIFLENLISQFRYQGRPAVIGSIMDITVRKESESGLRQSLHEKDILLREIHHRVKNNMQIIVSLLRMQTNEVEDPDIITILNESKNRILSMAMIHEKLYRTDNLMSVNLLEYLSSLVSTLINDFSMDESQITFHLVCDPALEMTIDAGIPLGLIINELLTNTFKHGFVSGEEGSISISVINSESGWLDITYRDSGKGLPEGFILENCESLGMQLIQNLVFQASGEMTMRSEKGILVSLRIPMNEGFIITEVSDATGE